MDRLDDDEGAAEGLAAAERRDAAEGGEWSTLSSQSDVSSLLELSPSDEVLDDEDLSSSVEVDETVLPVETGRFELLLEPFGAF